MIDKYELASLSNMIHGLIIHEESGNSVPFEIYEHLKEVNIFLLNRLNGDEG